MKRKLILCILSLSLLLTGCSSSRDKEENIIIDKTPTGAVNYQTSTLGIPEDQKKFQELLTSGEYYVVHDGVYYPTYYYAKNDIDEPEEYINPNRQFYFTTENEINIPTLYPGDKLVYYSTDSLLDYIIWERFYDLGYTIGITNLKEMTSGRIYLDLSDEDEENIVPASELYSIYDLKKESLLVDKIGGVPIDNTLVTDGLINACKKSKTYDLELYTGTEFVHYDTTANIHAFKSYELFASIEYNTLQEFLYEIEVPEYLPTGYYHVDGQGFIRICREPQYSETTNYNEQILFPEVDTDAWDYDPEEYIAPKLYSTYEPLNLFKTNQEGKLGYVDPEAEVTEAEEVAEDIKQIALKEAVTKEIDLYFPADRECKVAITSSTGETTGDISIKFDRGVNFLDYDRINKIYEITLTGHGEKGTLVISGLFHDYDITLTNVEQYNGQLEQPVTEDTDNVETSEESPEETSSEKDTEETVTEEESPRRR